VPKRRDDDAVNGAVCRLVTDDAGGNINRWLVTDRIGFRRMFQSTKHCGIKKTPNRSELTGYSPLSLVRAPFELII
jgi:hypothetical protein